MGLAFRKFAIDDDDVTAMQLNNKADAMKDCKMPLFSKAYQPAKYCLSDIPSPIPPRNIWDLNVHPLFTPSSTFESCLSIIHVNVASDDILILVGQLAHYLQQQ